MAESIVNSHLRNRWQAFSAGTEPAGYIHPKALQVLSEIDIHHEGVSKSIDQIKILEFDLVITVCDDAAENCPVWLGRVTRHHISFPDPAKVVGDEEAVLSAFRDVRGAIADQVIKFLSSYLKDGNPRRN
jgi:arsenate reductase